MTGASGATSLADLIRCATRLAADNATLSRLRTLLQLPALEGATSAASGDSWPSPAPPAVTTPDQPSTAGSWQPDVMRLPVQATLRGVAPRPTAAPWMKVAALPAAPSSSEPLPLVPLFPPRQRAAILSAAVSSLVPGDRPDLDALIAVVAAGRPLFHLQTARERRPCASAQLLIDGGEGMQPYRRDVADLAAGLEGVIGRSALEIVGFVRTPLHPPRAFTGGVPGWRPPIAGVPVVLVTDLGVGGPLLSADRAPLPEWLAFARRVHDAGCPAIAFTPFPRRRVPASLRALIRCVHWDRPTTAAQARRP